LGLSLATTAAGGANVVTPAFDPALSAQMMDEHGVTLMADFPPVLDMLLQARGEAKWEKLRVVFGLDSPEVIQKLPSETGARFWTGFGQAETSGVGTLGPADERPGSAGRPLPLATLRLVDESGGDVPLGQPGEIVLQGPLVFAGYWRDPDATEFAGRGGWHHTGDLGRFDEDGYLYYAGRKPEKELIKSGGENVYPAEVEHVILDLSEVAAVCVIGVPDEKYGETVKAVVELNPGDELSAEAVQQTVSDRIASFKKPRQVEFVEALPRLDSGEVDREQAKATYG
jgi:long-chain acyl-CoA synthetase